MKTFSGKIESVKGGPCRKGDVRAAGTWFRGVRPVWVAAAALFVVTAGIFSFRPAPRPIAAAAEPSTLRRAAGTFAGPANAGPWGELEFTDLWLEPPEEIMAKLARPDQRPIWRFPQQSVEAVGGLLEQAGLAAKQRELLLASDLCVVENNGITLLPPSTLVAALTPAVRQALYVMLARFPENPLHFFPVILPRDTVRELEATRISRVQRETLLALQWKFGDLPAFSDVAMLLQVAETSGEIAEAFRICARTAGLRMSVRLGGASPEEFRRFWDAGGRNSGAKSLIHALARGLAAHPVDAAMLLPTLARERLYTYPELSDGVGGRFPDCHWSSLNFFSEAPQPYYLDAKPSLLQLTQDHKVIDVPSQLGDLVCIIDGKGQIRHSCVYVAGDVVFTKNGQNLASPWILQRLSDTVTIYGAQGPSEVRYLRRKVGAD